MTAGEKRLLANVTIKVVLEAVSKAYDGELMPDTDDLLACALDRFNAMIQEARVA